MLPFEFGLGSFITVTVAALIASAGLVIFLGSKTPSARAFVLLTITITLWSIIMLLVAAVPSTKPSFGEFYHRLSYAAGILTAPAAFYFCFVFTKGKGPNQWLKTGLLLFSVIITPTILFTDIMFGGNEWVKTLKYVDIQVWGILPSTIPFSYDIIFSLLFVGGIILIYKEIKQTVDLSKKKRLLFMFWAFVIGFIPPSIFSMILPSLDIHQYDWLGPVTGIFWVSIITYSIMKYNQMNVRVAFTEMLVLAGILLLFINIFI